MVMGALYLQDIPRSTMNYIFVEVVMKFSNLATVKGEFVFAYCRI